MPFFGDNFNGIDKFGFDWNLSFHSVEFASSQTMPNQHQDEIIFRKFH